MVQAYEADKAQQDFPAESEIQEAPPAPADTVLESEDGSSEPQEPQQTEEEYNEDAELKRQAIADVMKAAPGVGGAIALAS